MITTRRLSSKLSFGILLYLASCCQIQSSATPAVEQIQAGSALASQLESSESMGHYPSNITDVYRGSWAATAGKHVGEDGQLFMNIRSRAIDIAPNIDFVSAAVYVRRDGHLQAADAKIAMVGMYDKGSGNLVLQSTVGSAMRLPSHSNVDDQVGQSSKNEDDNSNASHDLNLGTVVDNERSSSASASASTNSRKNSESSSETDEDGSSDSSSKSDRRLLELMGSITQYQEMDQGSNEVESNACNGSPVCKLALGTKSVLASLKQQIGIETSTEVRMLQQEDFRGEEYRFAEEIARNFVKHKAVRLAESSVQALKMRVPTSKHGDKATSQQEGRRLLSNTKCVFSANLQAQDSKDISGPWSNRDSKIKLIGKLQSPNCGASLDVNVTGMQTAKVFEKASNAGLLATVSTLAHLTVTVKQMRYSSAQSTGVRVSMLTISAQAVLDSYLCLVFLFLSVTLEPLFFMWGSLAFLQFVTFSMIGMRFILLVWKMRRTDVFEQGWDAVRRELGFLYIRLYGSLFIGLILFYVFWGSLELYVLFLLSPWVPQIIHSAQHNFRGSVLKEYVCVSSMARLLPVLYVTACPSNFMQIAPNFQFALVATLWMALQVGIVYLQAWKGGWFVIPRVLLPARYNYYRALPVAESAAGAGDVEMQGAPADDLEAGTARECVICMQAVDSSGRGAVTPCNHVFHAQCLEQWMAVKMECPTCRQPLPDTLDM